MESPAASVVTGHATVGATDPGGEVKSALTSSALAGWLPVLRTTTEKSTSSPAALTVAGVALGVTVSRADEPTETVASASGDVTLAPPGSVPVAAAVKVIAPSAMSAALAV